jgi:hypothetical protein
MCRYTLTKRLRDKKERKRTEDEIMISRASGTRRRQHPALCLAIVEFMKSLMYVPSGTPRESYVLPMSRNDAYNKFREQYVKIVKSCEISMADKTRFAQRVTDFLTHDVEVAKLTSDERKQHGRAWYNQDAGFSVLTGPIVIFDGGKPKIVGSKLEHCTAMGLSPQPTPMSQEKRDELQRIEPGGDFEIKMKEMTTFFDLLQGRADCLKHPVWCCPTLYQTLESWHRDHVVTPHLAGQSWFDS